jgi:hypothetical protein
MLSAGACNTPAPEDEPAFGVAGALVASNRFTAPLTAVALGITVFEAGAGCTVVRAFPGLTVFITDR